MSKRIDFKIELNCIKNIHGIGRNSELILMLVDTVTNFLKEENDQLIFDVLQKELLEANKHKDRITSGWKKTVQDALEKSSSSDITNFPDELKEGSAISSTFQAPNAGSYYKTTELIRVAEASPGKLFVLEQCVATSAPYGDKFRAMTKQHFEEIGGGFSLLKFETKIVFISSVNGLIKKMINSGAHDGMRKSATKFRAVIENYAEVFEAHKHVTTSISDYEVSGGERIQDRHSMLVTIFGPQLTSLLELWAGFAHAMLAHQQLFSWITPNGILVVMLIIAFMINLHIGVTVLRFIEFASSDPRTMFRIVSRLLMYFIHIPENMWEIFGTVVFVLCVREVSNWFASAIPAPPSSSHSKQNSSTSQDEETVFDDSQSGIKYDGYGKALKHAKIAMKHIDSNALKMVAQNNKMQGLQKKFMGSKQLKKNKESYPKRKQEIPDLHGNLRTEQGEESIDSTSQQKNTKTPEKIEIPTQFEHSSYEAPNLPAEVLHSAIVEEMYENQRLQPFRGWGSTWPGHFLPTDRTSRYSVRSVSRLDGITGQKASEVAPPLPEGWKWVEDSWKIDLSGVFADATDNEGWSYGMDFPNVKYPFPPGSGRKKLADFVRRRRWLRTRIPIEDVSGPEGKNAMDVPTIDTTSNTEPLKENGLGTSVKINSDNDQIVDSDKVTISREIENQTENNRSFDGTASKVQDAGTSVKNAIKNDNDPVEHTAATPENRSIESSINAAMHQNVILPDNKKNQIKSN